MTKPLQLCILGCFSYLAIIKGKDDLKLKISVVYSIPCECGKMHVAQTR